MVLFFPIQQELDCISDSGQILGKIKFDVTRNQHIFTPDNDALLLSEGQQQVINARLAGLDAGQFSIDMQDDD